MLILPESSTESPLPAFLAKPSEVVFTDYSVGHVYEVCLNNLYLTITILRRTTNLFSMRWSTVHNIPCTVDYPGAEQCDCCKPHCQSHPSDHSLLFHWPGWAFFYCECAIQLPHSCSCWSWGNHLLCWMSVVVLLLQPAPTTVLNTKRR